MTTKPSPVDEAPTALEHLLARMHQGDRHAHDELMSRIYRRLVLLSGTIQRTYPDLVIGHDPKSILHDSWYSFEMAIAKAKPPTVPDLFRLAARKVRQTLLTMAKRERGRRARLGVAVGGGLSDSSGSFFSEPGDSTYDPGRLALLTEFHRKAKGLPSDLATVFELHYYLGFTQAEIAPLVGLSPREVSRRWVAATERLAAELAGLEELLREEARHVSR